MRYFIELSYRGTHYHGWQVQPNAHSVQGEIERGLRLILRQPDLSIMGSGRTDTGVHAREQFAHFDVPEALDTTWLTQRLNAFLPKDIAIHRIFPVSSQMHARYSATQRSYEYHLVRKKSPFAIGLAYYYWHPLNIEAMQAAAATLTGYEDFQAFSKVKTQVKNFRCRIDTAYWETQADRWVFHVSANRFLRGMVRALVGTLLEVGKGTHDLESWDAIIRSKDRRRAGAAAPPEGLFLNRVRYPEHLFD